MGHIEVSDPTDLEHLYSNCTMESCSNLNDFMHGVHRTAAGGHVSPQAQDRGAGVDVPDQKKQRTLLRGLHQDAFDSFIEFAEKKEDWDDYV